MSDDEWGNGGYVTAPDAPRVSIAAIPSAREVTGHTVDVAIGRVDDMELEWFIKETIAGCADTFWQNHPQWKRPDIVARVRDANGPKYLRQLVAARINRIG